MSDYVQSLLEPIGLLCPWDFPGKNAGMGCHLLLQEIFPTQDLNLHLPQCRQTLYRLSHQGSHGTHAAAAAAAAAAKSLQSCPTLCDPIDGSPPGSPIPGILQARNTGVGCHFLLQYGAHESLDIQLCSYWAILHTTHIDYGKIIFYLIKR